jgi:hypothetical protein
MLLNYGMQLAPSISRGGASYAIELGVAVTRLLCDPLPYKNVLKVPHAKNLGENTVLALSTKCTKRSPRFSRVRYSGSGYGMYNRQLVLTAPSQL